MLRETWSGRNELLDEFRSAIERRTHGRLLHLSLDVIDGELIVESRTATYYAVQLALAAIETFTTDFPQLTPTKMSFRVNGHPLVLRRANADRNGETVSNDDLFASNDTMSPDRSGDQLRPSSLESHEVVTAP